MRQAFEAWLSMWKNIVNFSGETGRKEYWLALLTSWIVNGLLMFAAAQTGVQWLITAVVVAQMPGLLAFLSMYIRRANDADIKKGVAVILLFFVSWIGVLFVGIRPSWWAEEDVLDGAARRRKKLAEKFEKMDLTAPQKRELREELAKKIARANKLTTIAAILIWVFFGIALACTKAGDGNPVTKGFAGLSLLCIFLSIGLKTYRDGLREKFDGLGLAMQNAEKERADTHRNGQEDVQPKTAPVPGVKTAERSTKTESRALDLGTFDLKDWDRQRIKDAARRFYPQNLSADSYFELFNSLSCVMDLFVPLMKTESDWNMAKTAPDFKQEEMLKKAIANSAVAVNRTLAFLNPDYLINKVGTASSDELLKAWFVLDYYAFMLDKYPEHTGNIRHFRDYIHNALLHVEKEGEEVPVIRCEGHAIHFDSRAYLAWRDRHPLTPVYEFEQSILLEEKQPVLCLYEDNVKTKEYCLQTEENEDFSGKYFHIGIRISVMGDPAVPAAQIDGFISDTPEKRTMEIVKDIGYRMEVCFLACGGEDAKKRFEMNRGQDLPMKALKYVGYTTPASVRLIGVCPDCGKSFVFHGYAVYMAQSDVAYSDDGLDCCVIDDRNIDKDTWTYEADGKCFRYYNSFNCPNCGVPYIDYKKYPQNKVFGVSACVHLGRELYRPE